MIRSGLVLGGLLALGQIVNPGGGGGAPTGPCGGDLAGTMPNCTVASIANATGGATGLTNTVTITKPKSGGTTNLFNMLTPDAASSFVQFGLGRDGSTNDTVFFNYAHIGNNSSANYLAIDFYGVPDTVQFYPTGTIFTKGYVSGGTTFTVTGCGTATNLKGGVMAGEFTGASTTCNPVVTTGYTAPNGYACFAQDITTNITFRQTGSTTTTATFTSSGTAGATDRITFSCTGY